ncbi:MAG: dihydropteroate synthase [Thermodesulfobacteriota bacterium]|nr:dihydropteroate synthase [Thermodesulfobacteriota bacterium]
MTRYEMAWHNHRLSLGKHTLIMGILNITPDSFSDGGRFEDAGRAIRQAKQLVAAGADILDIGGESSRPFSDPVPEAMEIERTIPVIEALAGEIEVPISIDTTKAAVAEAAIAAGAAIVNDISALRIDPKMAAVAAAAEVPVVLMHMQGTPKTMQKSPVYGDVTEEVIAFLEKAAKEAEAQGIARDMIIVDPGIGFGKTVDHNLTLIRRLNQFHRLDRPVLVGPSRKAFIRKILAGGGDDTIVADDPSVIAATQAAITASVLGGAHIIRVHDVAEACTTLALADAISNAPA